MNRCSAIAIGGAIAAWLSGSALAHHSFAMFDRDKKVTLVGTVREFQWTNPHSWIEIDVPDSAGNPQKWSVEMNSPNNLGRQGWRSSTLKAGDKVTVIISPLRNGDKGGLFVSATLPSGKVLGDGVPPRPAPAAADESKSAQPTP